MRTLIVLVLATLLAACTSEADSGGQALLYEIETGAETTLPAVMEPLDEGRSIIFAGESHGTDRHHAGQLAIIRALHQRDASFAVGLEQMERRFQDALDDWVTGEVSEGRMEQVFARNWGRDMWIHYRPIFRFCRDEGIPMAALNVPRAITRKVARQGFESLTEEEIGMLPPIVCEVDPEYEAFLRRVLGGHGDVPEDAFIQFCEAQLVWDTAMAVHALDFMNTRDIPNMVVLTGSIHAWKKAMPYRVEQADPAVRRIVIQPNEPGVWDPDTVLPEDADYLLMFEEEQ
jgi:uncharacterized iron-regulated protein